MINGASGYGMLCPVGLLSVKVNNGQGSYFKCGGGVRQGDPLSPLLFNLAADSLAKMINMAQSSDLITGLVPEYIPKGVAVLQYADDTILCLKDDKEVARNTKMLLYHFENMSGLKINFNKSELIMVSEDPTKSLSFSEILNCAVGSWPIKYLGVPVSGGRLHVIDWLPLDEKLLKRLDGWKGKSLSSGGRLTLLMSCLSSIPIYCMSMYLLPKTVIKRMDKTRKRFMWQGGSMKKKYHLVKWTKLCLPKQKGGLGVHDLRKMNLSLLSKWWWKFEQNSGTWQEIVQKKYVHNRPITQLKSRPGNSPVWNDLIKVKNLYLRGRVMAVGNGEKTDFWNDTWCGSVALKDKFPELFDVCNEQEIKVSSAAARRWSLTFRRWLDVSIKANKGHPHVMPPKL